MKPLYPVHLRLSSQLLLLAGFMLSGMALGGVLSVGLGLFLYGLDLAGIQAALQHPEPAHAGMLMVLNTVSQLCTFLLPVLFYILLFGRSTLLPLGRPGWLFLILPMLWMASASPVIDGLALLNERMIPAGSWLESVARPSEESAMLLTHLFLSSAEEMGYAPLIIAMAIVPAICEEVAFRGVLQPILHKGIGNPHVAILLAAVAFSAVHVQLYGFLPRMVLGAGLGYLTWWSGSLWPAVLAHFANNALAILIYGYTGGQLEVQSPWPVQVGLLVAFTALTLVLMKAKAPQGGSS